MSLSVLWTDLGICVVFTHTVDGFLLTMLFVLIRKSFFVFLNLPYSNPLPLTLSGDVYS